MTWRSYERGILRYTSLPQWTQKYTNKKEKQERWNLPIPQLLSKGNFLTNEVSLFRSLPDAYWTKGSPWVTALVSLLSALLCSAAGLVWLAWDPGPGLGCQDLPQEELHGKFKHSGQAEMVRPTYDKCLKMSLCEMWLWDKHCCWQFVLSFCVNSQRQKCSCWRKCWWKMSHLCFSGSSVRSRNWGPMIPDVAFRD